MQARGVRDSPPRCASCGKVKRPGIGGVWMARDYLLGCADAKIGVVILPNIARSRLLAREDAANAADAKALNE